MRLNYKAATATVSKNRVWDVKFTGPLCRGACLTLGRYVRGVVGNDPVLERLDTSLIFTGDVPFRPEELRYLQGTAPGAIVCRPDQLELMSSFCVSLSAIGVVRLAFLDPRLARTWVECLV